MSTRTASLSEFRENQHSQCAFRPRTTAVPDYFDFEEFEHSVANKILWAMRYEFGGHLEKSGHNSQVALKESELGQRVTPPEGWKNSLKAGPRRRLRREREQLQLQVGRDGVL